MKEGHRWLGSCIHEFFAVVSSGTLARISLQNIRMIVSHSDDARQEEQQQQEEEEEEE